MKKLVLVACAALLAAPAFATPKVGDRAEFKLQAAKGDKALEGIASLELVAFDAAKKEYTQRLVFQWTGQAAQQQDDKVAEADLLTDADLTEILTLAGCTAQEGKLETITVPAGQFATCTGGGTAEDGSVQNNWLGKVPLGLVKHTESLDGTTITLALAASRAGH